MIHPSWCLTVKPTTTGKWLWTKVGHQYMRWSVSPPILTFIYLFFWRSLPPPSCQNCYNVVDKIVPEATKGVKILCLKACGLWMFFILKTFQFFRMLFSNLDPYRGCWMTSASPWGTRSSTCRRITSQTDQRTDSFHGHLSIVSCPLTSKALWCVT